MKKNWIVIYRGRKKGDPSCCSCPVTKRTAEALFNLNDGEYLVKIKRSKQK